MKFSKHALKWAAATGCCAAIAGFSFADTNGSPGDPGPNNLGENSQKSGAADVTELRSYAKDPATAGDKLFVHEAGCGNAFEVAFAKLAQEKSQDAQVKNLAKMIEEDHTKAQGDLKPIADKLSVKIPDALPEEKQAKLDIYRSMSAEDFDKAYLCCMKADHAKDITAFRDEAKGAKDDQVKQFAQQTVPALEKHAQMVMQVAQAKGVGEQAWMPGNTNNTAGANMNGMNGNNAGNANANEPR